jgi:hypothetical protein
MLLTVTTERYARNRPRLPANNRFLLAQRAAADDILAPSAAAAYCSAKSALDADRR